MKQLRLFMKTVKLEPKLNKEEIDKLEGTFLNETHFDTVITEDTRVLKENGEPLLVFKKNCIPANVCEQAYYSLRKAIGKTSNRAIAGGPIDAKVGDVIDGQVIGKLVGGNKYIPLKKDGTLSNTAKGKNVNSSIIGYADRYARIPYCRTTELLTDILILTKKRYPISNAYQIFSKNICQKDITINQNITIRQVKILKQQIQYLQLLQ